MEEVICVICSDQLFADDFIVATNCSHVYHEKCLQDWINRSVSPKMCPECRALLEVNESQSTQQGQNQTVKSYKRLFFKSDPKEAFHKQKEKNYQDQIIRLNNEISKQKQDFEENLKAESQIRVQMHQNIKKLQEQITAMTSLAQSFSSVNSTEGEVSNNH